MYDGIVTGLFGTVVLWIVSAFMAFMIAFIFTFGLLSKTHLIQWISRCFVNFSRGVPTSIYIIAGGLFVLNSSGNYTLPAIFPGTLDGFEAIAWAITCALAFGSSGHLAEIFFASYTTIDKSKIQQISAMGFSPIQKVVIVVHECAFVALPATSNRMIHHLHNTAFAGLFPVVEMFGSIQTSVNETFRVFYFIMIGCVIYIILSATIWAVFRKIEVMLTPQSIRVAI